MHPLAVIYGSAAACKHTETRLLQTPGKRREDRKQDEAGGGREKGEKKKKRNGRKRRRLIHYSCAMPDRKQPAGWWRTTGFRSVYAALVRSLKGGGVTRPQPGGGRGSNSRLGRSGSSERERDGGITCRIRLGDAINNQAGRHTLKHTRADRA